jgi:hypothetical protein
MIGGRKMNKGEKRAFAIAIAVSLIFLTIAGLSKLLGG